MAETDNDFLVGDTLTNIGLGFVRRALSTQEVPPNQVIIGLSLILTFMVMAPTWERIKEQAFDPYISEEISDGEAWRRASTGSAQGSIREALAEQPEATTAAPVRRTRRTADDSAAMSSSAYPPNDMFTTVS